MCAAKLGYGVPSLVLVVTITCCVYKQKGFVFSWVQPCNVPWGSEDKDGNLSLCTHLRTM